MSQHKIGRRPLIAGGAGALGTMLARARPAAAQSAARRETLVVALDFSDTTTLDPGRVAGYSNPMPTRAAYDPLVTMSPDDLITIKPCIATSWEYLPDGKTVRFKLRDDVKFVSGNPLTAEDVRFSFTRLLNMKYQASQYLAHVDHVAVVDAHTVDFVLKDPSQPLLTIIAAPEFGISEKAVVIAHGGMDGPDTADKDTATPWLDQNSVGSGAFRLIGWQRNQQISLVANPGFWGGKPGYDRLLIRHMSESAAQLLALKHGDVDVAFNLIPEQVATLKDDPDISIVRYTSLDYLYMAVGELQDCPALSKPQARQAIGYAIDYDGIINNLIGGNAVRPAAFLPVGVNGSTAETTKEIGYHQDLDRARKLLAEAGYPNGFTFKLSYANQSLAGAQYANVAQKLQSDLAQRRHHRRAQPDGHGEPVRRVHHRLQAAGGARILEPTGGGEPALGVGDHRAGGQAPALGRAARLRATGARRGGGARPEEGRRDVAGISEANGGVRASVRADAADLPGGGTQECLRPETDGCRLDG